ncbi:MAG: hypothetical protein ACK5OX_01645 [Desertimonas sp.]
METSAAAASEPGSIVWRVVAAAGPDAGAVGDTSRGSLVVGRSATADLTISDPAVELHHLLFDRVGDDRVRVTQLSGRAVARLGERPLGPHGAVLDAATVLFVGGTRLHIGPVDRWADLIWVVESPSGRTGPAADGRRWRWCRRPNRGDPAGADVDPLLVDLSSRSDHDDASTHDAPTAADVVMGARTGGTVAMRERDDGTMFRVQLGVVDAASRAEGAHPGVVIGTDLEAGQILQLVGPGAAGVARSVVLQLAVQVPPSRLAISLAGATGWLPDGVRFPHLGWPDSAQHHLLLAADAGLVTLDERQLRGRLGVGADAAVVVLDERGSEANAELPGARLVLGALGRGRWHERHQTVPSASVHAARVEPATVVELAPTAAPAPDPSSPPMMPTDGPLDPPTPLEAMMSDGRSFDAAGVARRWRRGDERGVGSVALNLGRSSDGVTWCPLDAGPVLVVADDDEHRRGVLAALACGLVLEHGPDRLRLVGALGVCLPAVDHVGGSSLPPGRIGHELARPRPRDGRTTVVVADDPDAEAPGGVEGDLAVLVASAARADVRLVIGVRSGHPWVDEPVMAAPSTRIVGRVGDVATSRRLLGEGRAARLGPGQILVRLDEQAPQLFRLPVVDGDGLARLAATTRHAGSLLAARLTPDAADLARTCAPCPDDDSRSVPPSWAPSNATMTATASLGD